jgi:hypothetical protein
LKWTSEEEGEEKEDDGDEKEEEEEEGDEKEEEEGDAEEDEGVRTSTRWSSSPSRLLRKAKRSSTLSLILLNSKYTLSTLCLHEIGRQNRLPSSRSVRPPSRAFSTHFSKSYASSYKS